MEVINPPGSAASLDLVDASPSGGISPYADLAAWLLKRETSGGADSVSPAEGAERACHKLSLRLSRLVSADGSQAIVSRVLHIAGARFAFLEGVRAGTPPGACLQGLAERAQQVQPAEAGRGLHALLSLLLGLLADFIGEELTLRLIRDIWSDLPFRNRAVHQVPTARRRQPHDCRRRNSPTASTRSPLRPAPARRRCHSSERLARTPAWSASPGNENRQYCRLPDRESNQCVQNDSAPTGVVRVQLL